MDHGTRKRYRDLMQARLAALAHHDAIGADGQRSVPLDQQSVGRLSRMDALQNQAMAKAEQARRDTQRRRLTLALARLETDEFGDCEMCGDAIAHARLDLDPAATLCISCARG